MTAALIVFLVLLFTGLPLYVDLGLSSFLYIFITGMKPIVVLQRITQAANSFTMIAAPFFILMGNLMNTGGVTRKLFRFANTLVGSVPGGMGHANILCSAMFAGMSGTAVADAGGLGNIEIEAMRDLGYDDDFSCAVTAASSVLGPIIPPSLPMVILAVTVGASIGRCFVGGILPGVLMALAMGVLVSYYSRKRHYPRNPKPTAKIIWIAFKEAIWALLSPIILFVSIYTGIVTTTEAAIIAALYSMIVGFFIYKELTWKDVWNALKKTLISSSSVMIIIGFSSIFTWVLTIQKVPDLVANFFMNMNVAPWGIALMFDVLILIIGTFIDVSPAILMLTPIMLPVMESYGFTALQFGAMLITGLAIGLVTPPVGMCLNACNKINRMPITDIFKGALPYITCNVLVLVLISLFPTLTTWLPTILGY